AFHVQDKDNFYYMSLSGGLSPNYPGATTTHGALYKIVDGRSYRIGNNVNLRIPHHGKELIDRITVESSIVSGMLRFAISRTELNYGSNTTYSDIFIDPSPSFTSGKFGFFATYEQYNSALIDNVTIKEME